LKGGTITETMQVFGVSFSEPSFYDSTNNRLYTNGAVFDSHLAMLAPINLPGSLVAFDPQRQRLYFSYRGNLLVAATSGGQLELPPPAEPDKEPFLTSKLLIASDGTRFRLDTFTARGARTSRLYRSTDAGDTWKMLGRGLPGSPEISALAISPDFEQNQTLLAGMAQRYSGGGGISAGGLYRSTDSGNTWLPVTHGLTSTRIKEITFSPTFTRDQTVFLIVTKLNDEEELFHSNNGGRSWISLNIKFANFIGYGTRFGLPVLSPTFVEDGLVFITVGEVLLRSADGGNTWVDTKIPGELVAFSPNFKDDNLIVTGSHWRSTDRGQSWQKAIVGSEVGLSASSFFFSPNFASDETIYMLRKGPDYTYEFTLQRSADAGRSWQNLVGGLPVGFEEATVTFLSTGELQLNTIKGQEAKVTLETLDWDK
jgi:photosystem II stability/assembly factor-like uncharacterized protein